MPVKLEDRPIETVKEEVIDVLIHNYSHGIISNEAFERRLDIVIKSTSHEEMVKQVEDLDNAPNEQLKRYKEAAFGPHYHAEPVEETDTIINIFGGSDRSGFWTVSKTINIISIFGGADIDFTDARFNSPDITINILGIFSGDNIYVPENVNVISKIFCIFGGVSNKAPSVASRQAPTITIKGLALFTGIDIKVKKTIKEKFVAFANQMKTMFSADKSNNKMNE